MTQSNYVAYTRSRGTRFAEKRLKKRNLSKVSNIRQAKL